MENPLLGCAVAFEWDTARRELRIEVSNENCPVLAPEVENALRGLIAYAQRQGGTVIQVLSPLPTKGEEPGPQG